MFSSDKQLIQSRYGNQPSVEHKSQRADNFVDSAADLYTKTYSEARTFFEIDSLVNSHIDGISTSKEQLEKTYKKIISNIT